MFDVSIPVTPTNPANVLLEGEVLPPDKFRRSAPSTGGCIATVARHPMASNPWHGLAPANATLAEILRWVERNWPGSVPKSIWSHGICFVNGIGIRPQYWAHVRPKGKDRNGYPIVAAFIVVPRGGDRRTIKNVALIVAAIAVVAASTAVGFGALTYLGFSAATFGKGTIGAYLASTAISVAGSLALTALAPMPVVKKPEAQEEVGSSSSSGNLLEPGGYLPRVIGTHKVFPKLISEPLIDIVGGEEEIEAVYALAGRHQWSDIRIADAPIDDIEDLTVELSEGGIGSAIPSLITRYAHNATSGIELTSHRTKPGSQNLFNQVDEEESCPQWHQVSTSRGPDEIWLAFMLPGGLIWADDPAEVMGLPLRVRMRVLGTSTWINLPEVHFRAKASKQYRFHLKLTWEDEPYPMSVDASTAVNGQLWTQFHTVPTQTSGGLPVTGWTTDSYWQASATRTDVAHFRRDGDGGYFYLGGSPSLFPRDEIWEVQVKRGGTYEVDGFNVSTYVMFAVAVIDFFGFTTTGSTDNAPGGPSEVTSTTILTRALSVFNQNPVQEAGDALLYMRGTNKAIQQVSTVASGYVYDWNGTDWVTDTISSNPATQWYHTWTSELNPTFVPTDLLDSANIVAWRQFCIDEGLTINTVVEGQSVLEVTQICAATGRARNRLSDVWGVFWDYDRSADLPEQVFSPVNSNNFSFSNVLAQRPRAFRVSFFDEAEDYRQRTIIVEDPYALPGSYSWEYEAIDLIGIVNEADAEARALYDWRQLHYRPVLYSLDVDIEALVCRRGSLVGINYDTLNEHHYAARIKSVTTSGPNTTGLVLDREVGISNETTTFSVSNFLTVSNVFNLGQATGVAIRKKTGAILIKEISTATSSGTTVVTFTTPFTTDVDVVAGCLVVFGPLDKRYERFIITDIKASKDLTATLTLVDEAPEVVA